MNLKQKIRILRFFGAFVICLVGGELFYNYQIAGGGVARHIGFFVFILMALPLMEWFIRLLNRRLEEKNSG
jgi:hypothetical protein